MKDTFTFENMGTASTKYLKEALKNPKKYQEEQMNEKRKLAEIIKEILEEEGK